LSTSGNILRELRIGPSDRNASGAPTLEQIASYFICGIYLAGELTPRFREIK